MPRKIIGYLTFYGFGVGTAVIVTLLFAPALQSAHEVDHAPRGFVHAVQMERISGCPFLEPRAHSSRPAIGNSLMIGECPFLAARAASDCPYLGERSQGDAGAPPVGTCPALEVPRRHTSPDVDGPRLLASYATTIPACTPETAL
jgi:hypothetical protein